MGKEAKKAENKKSNVEAAAKKPKSTGMEKYPKEDGKGKKEKGLLPLPPPPEELEMRVYMHCEGCAKKLKKILRNFDGVEDTIVDFKTRKVVVKGKKVAANPMKVVALVHEKTRHWVELVSPIPFPPEEKKEEKKNEELEPPKPEEKEPLVTIVVLKVHIHCKVCAQWITKRILKMKGVQSAEPDIAASKVTMMGVFEEAKLPEYVYKCIGKHVTIIKSEPSAPSESVGGDGKTKEKKKKAEGGEEKEGSGDTGGKVDKEDVAAIAAANMYLSYPQFAFPGGYYPPPQTSGYVYQPEYPPPPYAAYTPHYQIVAPHILSDENPNTCSFM